jgi:non-canonical poly(A) RNA polymerase PAPD5/7
MKNRPLKKLLVPAYDRPILSLNAREKTPELMAGMVTGGEYLVAPDETDGEEGGGGENTAGPECDANEVEMEFSDSDAKHDSAAPPDPATEADQFVEAEKKRMDVISMIRSFKTKPLAEKPRNPIAENDDFIPLSFGDERKPRKRFQDKAQDRDQEEDGSKRRKKNDGTTDISPGSKFSHRDNHFSQYEEKQLPRDPGAPGTSDAPNFKLSPPSGLSGVKTPTTKSVKTPNSRESQNRSDSSKAASGRNTSPRPPHPISKKLLDIPQGRKRKHAEITHRRTEVDGNITSEYQASHGINPVPWTKIGSDHSRCLSMGAWYVPILVHNRDGFRVDGNKH